MSYRSIPNLYKSRDVLLFKQCYAMEKIHGTSAHIKYNHTKRELSFFSGGSKYDQFIALFDQQKLLEAFSTNAEEHDVNCITIYGEAYGGKLQGMSKTYGPNIKFIAFEVQADEQWFGVEQANRVATRLGFEFVHYRLIDATEEAISAEILLDSVQAIRNGMGEGHMREGVVLRAPIELFLHNGGRIICKHKRPEFAEREHTPRILAPEDLKILEDANAIADEWVTPMRFAHILDAFPEPSLEQANKIIRAMMEDVVREASGEIVDSKEARRAIGKKTIKLLKEFLSFPKLL